MREGEDETTNGIDLKTGGFEKSTSFRTGSSRSHNLTDLREPSDQLIVDHSPNPTAAMFDRNERLQCFDNLIFGAIVAKPDATNRITTGGFECFHPIQRAAMTTPGPFQDDLMRFIFGRSFHSAHFFGFAAASPRRAAAFFFNPSRSNALN